MCSKTEDRVVLLLILLLSLLFTDLILFLVLGRNMNYVCPENCRNPDRREETRIREFCGWFGWDTSYRSYNNLKVLTKDYETWKGHVNGHNMVNDDIVLSLP